MDAPHDVYSEIRSWWQEVYERTKGESLIKETDLLYLVDILPLPVFNKVLQILNLEPPPKSIPATSVRNDSQETVRCLMGSNTVNVPCPTFNSKLANPYVDFFKRPAEQLKIWRSLDANSTVTTGLDKIADNLARDIAENFVVWFKSLGGVQKTNITVDTLLHMFEIGSPQNGATSLRVETKEHASVPESVAKSFNKPERSSRLALLREMKRDADAAKRRPRIAAFGSSLPGDMRQAPRAVDLHESSKKQVHARKALSDMSAVWEGITHLKSTRGYCDFLLRSHPEVKPPKYLVESGLFKRVDNEPSMGSLRYLG